MNPPHDAKITVGQTIALAIRVKNALDLVHHQHGWTRSTTELHKALAQVRAVMAEAHGMTPDQIVPDGGIKPPSSGR